jgi:hypothetical protein
MDEIFGEDWTLMPLPNAQMVENIGRIVRRGKVGIGG